MRYYTQGGSKSKMFIISKFVYCLPTFAIGKLQLEDILSPSNRTWLV